MPAMTNNPVRPLLVARKLKVAATKTIANNRTGPANRLCQYKRWLSAEKPADSKVSIKSGNSQKERVFGDAKLS